MRSPYDEWLKVRISKEQQDAILTAASVAQVPVSEYVRSLLPPHSQDAVSEQIRQLNLALQQNLDEPEQGPSGSDVRTMLAVQIETLVLLRSLASPAHLKQAHAEVRQVGLSPWTPTDAIN